MTSNIKILVNLSKCASELFYTKKITHFDLKSCLGSFKIYLLCNKARVFYS